MCTQGRPLAYKDGEVLSTRCIAKITQNMGTQVDVLMPFPAIVLLLATDNTESTDIHLRIYARPTGLLHGDVPELLSDTG
jgi:hypothetical protein